MPPMAFPGMESFPPPARDNYAGPREMAPMDLPFGGGPCTAPETGIIGQNPRRGGGYEARLPPQATLARGFGHAFPDDDGGNRSPRLPCASPIAGELVCPLGEGASPHLTTPQWNSASGSTAWPPMQGQGGPAGPLGSLSQIDSWAWEMGSDVASIPSAWSKATSSKTGKSSGSKMSSATGVDGLIPGLVDGQRLSAVKPSTVPTRGGKVIVSLRKEVPQGYWDTLSIVLVKLPTSVTVKPTGIKKGKKLCIDVPPLSPDDYDVRLKFGEKIIHGSIPLSIRDDEEEGEEMDDELREVAAHFDSLAT